MSSVGIDCRFASFSAGLGTYTRELVTALCMHKSAFSYVLFVTDTNENWLSNLPPGVQIRPVPSAHYSLEEQLQLPQAITRAGVDVYYAPHFNVPLFCPVPFLCTVQDLILHRFPNRAGWLKRLAYRLLFAQTVRRAQHIFTISNVTRDDLVSHVRAAGQDKVSVVYPGVSEKFYRREEPETAAVKQKYGLQKNFLLYVGNAKQHKNVQTLIDAFRAVQEPDLELVLVTPGKEAASLKIDANVKLLSSVREDDLAALYSSARGFVTATLYEGFGLPPIEALCCGCPVLASDIPVIREICGEYALFAAPTVDGFVAGIKRLLVSPAPLPDPAVLRQKYSWHGAADKTRDLLSATIQSLHG